MQFHIAQPNASILPKLPKLEVRLVKAEHMKCFQIALTLVISSLLASAQVPQTAAPDTGAWSPAKSIGMFAYPKNQQTADQQLKDESQCYGSARQQTGVDPQASPAAQPSPEEQKAAQGQAAQQAGTSVPKGGAVKGSARGAAGGAAIGAVAGDAGQGAAIGATVGAMGGRRRQKKAEKEAQKEASQQAAQKQQQAQGEAKAKHEASLDSFKRAFSACMDARGYSVK